jgi:hypothetical protein
MCGDRRKSESPSDHGHNGAVSGTQLNRHFRHKAMNRKYRRRKEYTMIAVMWGVVTLDDIPTSVQVQVTARSPIECPVTGCLYFSQAGLLEVPLNQF